MDIVKYKNLGSNKCKLQNQIELGYITLRNIEKIISRIDA